MSGEVEFEVAGNKIKLASVKAVDIVDSGMVYPQYKSVAEKEIKECSVKLNYMCDQEKCDFRNALTAIDRNADLKGLGIKDTTDIVCKIISEDQNLFTASEVAGYVLQAGGTSHVYIRNQGFINKENDRRVGFLDLTEARRRMIYRYEHDRKYFSNGKDVAIGTAIGITLTYSLLKFAGKIVK